MRIIGGNFKGKKLIAPANLPVRPTTDFAKTGIFNILATQFEFVSCNVIDLYSGTGSFTYEFYSRGCIRVQSVDRNRDCVTYIKATLERLSSPGTVRVTQADAITYLKKNTEQFDIIFADLPFDMDVAAELSDAVFNNNKLTPGGVFVLEHVTGRDYASMPYFQEIRKYGNVSFTLFKRS